MTKISKKRFNFFESGRLEKALWYVAGGKGTIEAQFENDVTFDTQVPNAKLGSGVGEDRFSTTKTRSPQQNACVRRMLMMMMMRPRNSRSQLQAARRVTQISIFVSTSAVRISKNDDQD